ncbi:MAG TPA: alpha/beta fold hydrolase [Candidatus Eisenbacteria bacterium]
MRFTLFERLFAFLCVAVVGTATLTMDARAQGASVNRVPEAETFVDLLAAGDFSSAFARFDPQMQAGLPEAQLKSIWATIQAQAGPYRNRLTARAEKAGAYDVVFVPCDFEKARLDAKIVFDSEGWIAGLFFVPVPSLAGPEWQAPDYVKPDSFHEQDMTVGSGEWALPGTPALPVGPGPFPALVLVHGSGPHDRDETIGPNKTFRDLAQGLASRGIAVLRYEKRTKAHGKKMAGMTSLKVKEETVDDAVAAVAAVAGVTGIDPHAVFVLGHSLGGTVIPRIAARTPDAAGYIVLAGATRPLEEVALEQVAYLMTLDSAGPDEMKQLESMKMELEKVKALDPANADTSATFLGVPTAYWLDLRSLKPAEAAREIKQPMLILQGERDYQVTMTDFRNWKEALGKRSNVTLVSYPDLNHLFVTGTGRSTPAEYLVAGHVSGTVVDRIARWVGEVAGKGKE